MGAAESELCGICFTSELGAEACVRLASCGHVFHAACVKTMLSHRWTTLRVSFGYLGCPSCKQEMRLDYCVPQLTELFDAAYRFKSEITRMAMEKAIEERLDRDERLTTAGDFYHNDLQSFAMHSLAFYECNKCS